MKKVLVAGAALLLTGAAASAAYAEVNLSGDARATYVGLGDYLRENNASNGYSDYLESRINLNIDAAAAGGTSITARVYFDDYGHNDDAMWDGYETDQVSVDYAYMDVPLTERFKIRAGHVPVDTTVFFSWYNRASRVMGIYENPFVKLVPILQVTDEFADTGPDEWNDNDFMGYGLITDLKFQSGWKFRLFTFYNDDQREWDSTHDLVTIAATDADGNDITMAVPAGRASGGAIPMSGAGGGANVPAFEFDRTPAPHADRSGFLGTALLTGSLGPMMEFAAEVGYKAADVQGTEDDGLGGYIQLTHKMPGFTPALIAGMTQNGFMADDDFGFVMVGGNESTTVVNVGNPAGDLWFGALVVQHDVSSNFSLTGNLLYASYDNDTAGGIESAVEVSGIASYVLSESTELTYKLGYLTPSYDGGDSAMEDAYIGQLIRLDIAF